MERFTHKSHWPDGHWTIPLVQFCDENGKLPQDGQFVPQAVIDRLAAYEDAAENKAEIVRCRDCIHVPHYSGRKALADDPDDYRCPFLASGDPWESECPPDDDFFCAYGERKEERQ